MQLDVIIRAGNIEMPIHLSSTKGLSLFYKKQKYASIYVIPSVHSKEGELDNKDGSEEIVFTVHGIRGLEEHVRIRRKVIYLSWQFTLPSGA